MAKRVDRRMLLAATVLTSAVAVGVFGASEDAPNDWWLYVPIGVAILALSAMIYYVVSPDDSDNDEDRPRRRTGIVNRETGKMTVKRSRFGRDLDIGIDNHGELSEEDSDFD